MTTPLRRRQVLGLGLAGLGTAVVGPLLWDRLQRSAARAQPAGAARLASRGGVADLELDLLRRRVTRGGKRIDLTAKEFGLLELLMRRQGEVLPRSLIASQVWDMNFDSDTNVIEVAMRRLRLKVDDGQSVKLIQTVRGMGYVLEAAQEP
jgi:DNA-binding response OmpR family regulator